MVRGRDPRRCQVSSNDPPPPPRPNPEESELRRRSRLRHQLCRLPCLWAGPGACGCHHRPPWGLGAGAGAPSWRLGPHRSRLGHSAHDSLRLTPPWRSSPLSGPQRNAVERSLRRCSRHRRRSTRALISVTTPVPCVGHLVGPETPAVVSSELPASESVPTPLCGTGNGHVGVRHTQGPRQRVAGLP